MKRIFCADTGFGFARTALLSSDAVSISDDAQPGGDHSQPNIAVFLSGNYSTNEGP
jgi:hypothetical protein